MYDNDTFTFGGRTFLFRVEPDYDAGPPWEREDGHGLVSEWRSAGYSGYAPKAPGERPLCSDRCATRFYDFAGAVRRARSEGWRATEDRFRWDLKPGELAARAAEEDFDRLRQWCNDQWGYIGVLVQEVDGEGNPIGPEVSLWGIESDAGEYLKEVADELASELISASEKAA